MEEILLYNRAAMIEQSGITERQYIYWIEHGWLHPIKVIGRNDHHGSGASFVWTPEEIDVARRMGAWVAQGVVPRLAEEWARRDHSADRQRLAATRLRVEDEMEFGDD